MTNTQSFEGAGEYVMSTCPRPRVPSAFFLIARELRQNRPCSARYIEAKIAAGIDALLTEFDRHLRRSKKLEYGSRCAAQHHDWKIRPPVEHLQSVSLRCHSCVYSGYNSTVKTPLPSSTKSGGSLVKRQLYLNTHMQGR